MTSPITKTKPHKINLKLILDQIFQEKKISQLQNSVAH